MRGDGAREEDAAENAQHDGEDEEPVGDRIGPDQALVAERGQEQDDDQLGEHHERGEPTGERRDEQEHGERIVFPGRLRRLRLLATAHQQGDGCGQADGERCYRLRDLVGHAEHPADEPDGDHEDSAGEQHDDRLLVVLRRHRPPLLSYEEGKRSDHGSCKARVPTPVSGVGTLERLFRADQPGDPTLPANENPWLTVPGLEARARAMRPVGSSLKPPSTCSGTPVCGESAGAARRRPSPPVSSRSPAWRPHTARRSAQHARERPSSRLCPSS